MSRPRILLLGADGQLGTELRRTLAPQGTLVAATLSGRLGDAGCEAADFSRPDTLPALLERVAPDIVVNAAAYTAVDRAEQEVELAFRINAEAPDVLASACAARGAVLVHYSTDYVFDGQGTRPYREDDTTSPLGVYGASKLAGEVAVLSSGARHMVFRTAWVHAAHSHNFLRTMLRLGAGSEALRVVADQVGTPTPAAQLADVTARALRADGAPSGLWHATSAGQASRHAFAVAIIEGAVARGLLARAPRIEAIATAGQPTPAARPAWSVLDCGALRRDFGIALPDWRDGLAATLDELARNAVRP